MKCDRSAGANSDHSPQKKTLEKRKEKRNETPKSGLTNVYDQFNGRLCLTLRFYLSPSAAQLLLIKLERNIFAAKQHRK